MSKNFDYEGVKKEILERHRQRLERLEKAREVAQFTEALDYFNKADVLCDNAAISLWSELRYVFYDVVYEEIVENIAGPLHRKFALDWELTVASDHHLTLTSRNRWPRFPIVVLAIFLDKRKDVCRIVKRVIRRKSDEELEAEREVVERFLVCDEDDGYPD